MLLADEEGLGLLEFSVEDDLWRSLDALGESAVLILDVNENHFLLSLLISRKFKESLGKEWILFGSEICENKLVVFFVSDLLEGIAVHSSRWEIGLLEHPLDDLVLGSGVVWVIHFLVGISGSIKSRLVRNWYKSNYTTYLKKRSVGYPSIPYLVKSLGFLVASTLAKKLGGLIPASSSAAAWNSGSSFLQWEL